MESEEIILRANTATDEDGQFYAEPEFPQYQSLLYVNESARADEIREHVESLEEWNFLRREVID
jgi:hypothetical protein